MSVPKELVALMSAIRDGEAPDPEDPSRKVYRFTQKVSSYGPDLVAELQRAFAHPESKFAFEIFQLVFYFLHFFFLCAFKIFPSTVLC